MTTIELISTGAIFVAGTMILLWIYSVRHSNAGVVDIGWTAGVMIMALLYIAESAYLPRSLADFFEWLVWVGLASFALASPYGYLALVCPALMLFFLFRVTGIPATEAQALRTRGDDYARYQRTISAFFPWFPRESETVSGK